MRIVIEIDDDEIRRQFAPLLSPSPAPPKPEASRLLTGRRGETRRWPEQAL